MKHSAILSIVATLYLFGCASFPETLSARRIEPGNAFVLNSKEIVIFGRILFTENGMSKIPYGLSKPLWQITTPEREQAPGEPGPVEKRRVIPFLSTGKDGAFRYVIPAGRYAVTHVVPLYYTPMIDPAMEFDAGEPGYAYYLGDFEVDFDSWSWLGGLWGNYITRIRHLEVVDRFDEVRDLFLRDFPNSYLAKKALLVPIKGRQPGLKEQYVPPIIHK